MRHIDQFAKTLFRFKGTSKTNISCEISIITIFLLTYSTERQINNNECENQHWFIAFAFIYLSHVNEQID